MAVEQIIQKRKEEKIVKIKDALTDEKGQTFSSGLKEMDSLLDGGFRPGDLIVLSGRSGNGKTTVGLNFMKNMVDLNPVLFSYEVQINRVYDKLVKMMMGPDPNIYTPKKNVSGDVNWIRDRIIEAIEIFDSKLVVIDHLDFITSDHTNDDGRRNEINSIIKRIKETAVEKDLIIILQVHVKKGEGNNRPLGNEDLADSRAIANLADFVMFVNRETDENNLAVGSSGRLVLTKNRYNGRQGVINYKVNSLDLINEL
jgi:replicative DNA helicase